MAKSIYLIQTENEDYIELLDDAWYSTREAAELAIEAKKAEAKARYQAYREEIEARNEANRAAIELQEAQDAALEAAGLPLIKRDRWSVARVEVMSEASWLAKQDYGVFSVVEVPAAGR